MEHRRRISYCLQVLIVAALTGLPVAFAQGNQVPFSITIDADTNVFKAGSEIRIRLIFKNTSGAEIPYVRGPGIGVGTARRALYGC